MRLRDDDLGSRGPRAHILRDGRKLDCDRRLALAAVHGAKVHVVHAWHSTAVVFDDPDFVPRHQRHFEQRLASEVKAIAGESPNVTTETRFGVGYVETLP